MVAELPDSVAIVAAVTAADAAAVVIIPVAAAAAAVVVVVVVEYYCFLINIIDVGVVRVADVSYGLFCIHIKIEGFV